MATAYWIANAAKVPYIQTSTIGGTWLTDETITLTINGKDLIITVGTPVTTTDIAALIVAAWNASTRLNATTGSANCAGQDMPEFAEIVASNSGAVVTFTNASNYIGEPFTITKATTSVSGTVGAITTTQTGTRPQNFNDADNWSIAAVPSTNDTLVFRDSAISCTDNFQTKRYNIDVYNTFTGALGRPPMNRTNSSKPYYDYRQTHLISDNSGAGTATTFNIGIGDGPGPSLVNIKQTGVAATVNVDINSRPNEAVNGAGSRVVNVIDASGLTVNVRKGSVDLSDQSAVSASVTSLNIVGREGNASDIDVLTRGNTTTSCTVTQIGGTLTIDWAAWASSSLTQRGGITKIYTAGCPSMQLTNGTFYPMNTQTVTTITLNKAGTVDTTLCAGTLTFTNANFYEGCKVVNPGKKITHTNAIASFGSSAAIAANLDYGYNRTLQIAG